MGFEEDQELQRLIDTGQIPPDTSTRPVHGTEDYPRPDKVNIFEEETPVSDEDQAAARLNEVAQEVMRGEWGSGQSRRLKLAEAGFDPVQVQREIILIANNRT